MGAVLLSTSVLGQTNAPKALLLDEMGRAVEVPTNQLPSALQPSTTNWINQMPTPVKGASMAPEVMERMRQEPRKFEWFPATQPLLMPYLASQDEFGNTALRPGALIPFSPLEMVIQPTKYWLSEYGLRYSLQQTLTYVTMTGVDKGANNLGYYTFDFQGKWAVYSAPDPGMAGWVSTHVEAKTGLGASGEKEDARKNIGSITDPTGIWSDVNGIRVPELAWQQSARDGEIVLVAGVVNQGDYIDQNAYAQSGRSHFMNSALITSEVLPEPKYNFGLNLQWQPLDEWYAMAGWSAGDNGAGYAPWTDFSLNNWWLIGEFGYAPRDFLGLGPGIYRVQPFFAEVGGSTGGGLCFNLQQQLGEKSPFGWFGRFGFGGEDVSADAGAQIGTGFIWQGPMKHLVLQRTSNDLLGVAVVWSQPNSTTKTIYHENEYVLETFYSMQLLPTLKLTPDFQYVEHPAYNGKHDHSFVFQIQLALAW